MEIRENQIEDILVNAPSLTKNILRLDEEPRLIGRQIIVPSGRLDILYAYKSHLLLVELKVVPFKKKFIQQVLEYKNDLIEFQNNGKMLKGEIYPYLLFPSVTETLRRITQNENVEVVYQDNSKTTLFVTLSEGWQISFRIHNASSRIEPSLKFDINLVSAPHTLFSNQLFIG